MKLFDMKKRREELLSDCDRMLNAAKDNASGLTPENASKIDEHTAEVNRLSGDIQRIESVNTLRALYPTGQVIADPARHNNGNGNHASAGKFRRAMSGKKRLSEDYADAFATWSESRGRILPDALQEGSLGDGGYMVPTIGATTLVEGTNSAGGFAVPISVAGEIIPLAPPEFGVQTIAQIIPTQNDLKFPSKLAHGTAAMKTEATGAFAGTDPTLTQFTLSAFMIGHIEDASWELLQDVSAFQAFMSDDILLSIAVLKEAKFVSGSGTGEPQGLVGNTGAGVTAVAADSFGNKLPISATFDVLGTLNAVYHPNASWLMSRVSSIILRKAQFQANLFEPVFNRVGGTDYLQGYPVTYSSSMPAATTTLTPVLFGDFKRGYLIGERGGNGVAVKILDQTKAANGLLEVLGYQRVDGRVRRSEAIQAITLV
jgi:HK97 family phage major capsid protein